ncbi:hypothetical protein ACOL23_02040 [Aliarcobacter butzleri]
MIKFVLILMFIIFQINLLCAEEKIDYIELDVMDKQHIIEKISKNNFKIYTEENDDKMHQSFLKIKTPIKNTGLIFFEDMEKDVGFDLFPILIIPTEQKNKFQKVELPPIKQEGGSPFVSSVFYVNIDNDIEEELLIIIRWPQRHYDYSGTFYKVYVYDFIKNKDNSFTVQFKEDISKKLECSDIVLRDGNKINDCNFEDAKGVKRYLRKLGY